MMNAVVTEAIETLRGKTKLCMDCEYCEMRKPMDLILICTHPELVTIDPVVGRVNSFCENQRSRFSSVDGKPSKCGPDALLWEATMIPMPTYHQPSILSRVVEWVRGQW